MSQKEITCALYLRVSTDRQRKEGHYGIPTQAKSCKEFAERQNWQIVGNTLIDLSTGQETTSSDNAVLAFVDDETANKGNEDRPALQACLAYAENTGFDFLVVDRVDRFSRGQSWQRAKTEESFQNLGVKVVYADINNIKDTLEDNLLKGIYSEFSVYDNDRRARLTRENKRAKAEENKFVSGRTSYGYAINKECFGGLEVIEKEAETVRLIYDLFINKRYSISQIAKHLNSLGIPAHQGGKWNRSSVWRVLNNETYIGKITYGKYRSYKKNGKQIFVKNDSATFIEHKAPAIIEEKVFKKAKKLLEHNRKVKRQESPRSYLLSEMIFCDVCGKAFSGQTKIRKNKEDSYYAHLVKRGGCNNVWLRSDTVTNAVWNKVKEILLHPETLIAGFEKDQSAYQKAMDEKETELAFYQTKLDKLKKQRTNLNQLYTDPEVGLTKGEYIEQRESINSGITELENTITDLTDELSNMITPEDIDSFKDFVAKVKTVLKHELSDDEKRTIMQKLNIKVKVIDKENIRLDGYFTTETFNVTDVHNMLTLQTPVTHLPFTFEINLAA